VLGLVRCPSNGWERSLFIRASGAGDKMQRLTANVTCVGRLTKSWDREAWREHAQACVGLGSVDKRKEKKPGRLILPFHDRVVLCSRLGTDGRSEATQGSAVHTDSNVMMCTSMDEGKKSSIGQ
jgi:hypothetical protein